MYQKGAKFVANGKKLNLNKFGAGMGDLSDDLFREISQYAFHPSVDIPQRVVRFDEDFKIVEFRNENGQLHRLDGPAKRLYNRDENGPYGSMPFRELWYRNGQLHRKNGPAWIWYNKDGSIYIESWYKDGQLHREDGPASIAYDNNGDIEEATWYKNDQRHREDGPAYIYIDPTYGVQESYYLSREMYDKPVANITQTKELSRLEHAEALRAFRNKQARIRRTGKMNVVRDLLPENLTRGRPGRLFSEYLGADMDIQAVPSPAPRIAQKNESSPDSWEVPWMFDD